MIRASVPIENINMKKGVMLAKEYKDQPVVGFWMSEKYDGIRAVWNGKYFVTRNNKKIFAPEWFYSSLPKSLVLDGELYSGENRFEQTSSTVRKHKPIDAEWKTIKYLIFDCIESGTFEQRQKILKSNVSESNIIKIVKHKKISQKKQMNDFYKNVLKRKGEGIMLRLANSAYEQKRSKFLLKLKPQSDDEAIVIGIIEGNGKYVDKLGALLVRTASGIEFKVGSGFTDEERETLWSQNTIGKRISYTFRGKTSKNVPRFATFHRMRQNKY
jgi:DNA ligase-1